MEKRVKSGKAELVTVAEDNANVELCYCRSWIRHWEKYAKEVAIQCAAEGCSEPVAHCARVKLAKAKFGGEDISNYVVVVPVCEHHNALPGGQLIIKPLTAFVWANVLGTCGKHKKKRI